MEATPHGCTGQDGWIGALRSRIGPVIEATGGTVIRGRHAAPCPACHEEHRSRTDRRKGPVHFRPETGAWACQRCGARGDAVTWLALVELGRVPGRGDPGWRTLAERAEGLGLADPREVQPREQRREPSEPPPVERDGRRLAEVLDLWHRAAMPGLLRPFLDYMKRRGLHSDEALRVAGYGMVGWVNDGADLEALPEWARWHLGLGYRAIVPVYDAHGCPVEVRFRWPGKGKPPRGRAKSESAPGSAGMHRDTVIAPCPMMRALLRAGPSTRPGVIRGEHGPVRWDGTVCLVEGEGDAWALAAAYARRGQCPATGWPAIGAYSSGTWGLELTRRLPRCAEVSIFPDPDEAGERLARRIAELLDARGIAVALRAPEVA